MFSEDSRAKIKENFLVLLKKKHYEKISFKEIAQESNMSRQNLYHYYGSKEQLLFDLIDDMYEDFYNIYDDLFDEVHKYSADVLIQNLCVYIIDHKDLLSITATADFGMIMFNKYTTFAKRMLGKTARENNIKIVDDEALHYLALQISSAIFFPARDWIRSGMNYPIDKIVCIQSRVLDKSLLQTLKQTQELSPVSKSS